MADLITEQQVGNVTDKVLTETLRRLETADFVSRSVVPSVPIEVDYELTSVARSLLPVLAN